MNSNSAVMRGALLSAFLIALFLYSARAETAPPTAEVTRSQLATQIPSSWKVVGYTIEASANYGNDVEPEFRQRVAVTLAPETDEFLPAGQSGQVTFLVPSVRSDEQRKIYLIARSSLRVGTWHTTFDLPPNFLQDLGKPRDDYQGKTIVKGSSEEASYWQAQKVDADRVHQMELTEIARQDELRRAQEKQVQEARREAEESYQKSLSVIDDNVRKLMVAKLPSFWHLDSFGTSEPARENGPRGEQVVQHFLGKTILSKDTFVVQSGSGPVVFLTPALKAGTQREFSGIAVSAKVSDGWESKLDLAEPITSLDGLPLSQISGRAIVRGSAEEDEYRKFQEAEAERSHQQALAAVHSQQDLEAAKVAADAALARQRSDVESAEKQQQEKQEAERRAASERRLTSLAQTLAGVDPVKRAAAIRSVLASGNKDEIGLVLASTLARQQLLTGVLTIDSIPGYNIPATSLNFAVKISSFDPKGGNFQAVLSSSAFGGDSTGGLGSLQGLTLSLTTQQGGTFQGDFDGSAKFVGRMTVPAVRLGNFNYPLSGSHVAEISVF